MDPTPETFDDSLLSAYLDGELDALERARIEEILRHNPERQTQLRDLQAVRDRLRTLESLRAPADFRDRVLHRIAATTSNPSAATTSAHSGLDAAEFPRPHRLLRWSLVAASLAALWLLGLFLRPIEPTKLAEHTPATPSRTEALDRDATKLPPATTGSDLPHDSLSAGGAPPAQAERESMALPQLSESGATTSSSSEFATAKTESRDAAAPAMGQLADNVPTDPASPPPPAAAKAIEQPLAYNLAPNSELALEIIPQDKLPDVAHNYVAKNQISTVVTIRNRGLTESAILASLARNGVKVQAMESKPQGQPGANEPKTTARAQEPALAAKTQPNSAESPAGESLPGESLNHTALLIEAPGETIQLLMRELQTAPRPTDLSATNQPAPQQASSETDTPWRGRAVLMHAPVELFAERLASNVPNNAAPLSRAREEQKDLNSLGPASVEGENAMTAKPPMFWYFSDPSTPPDGSVRALLLFAPDAGPRP